MTTGLRQPHRPAENIMLSTPIGLDSLGSDFNPHAPFSACRLCGALYQSKLDLLCFALRENGTLVEIHDPIKNISMFTGPQEACNKLDESTDRRERWRKLHERRYHSEEEITAFNATGFALTPEAAFKLAPFGITPLGNMHGEIVDALLSAPRAPYNDAEY